MPHTERAPAKINLALHVLGRRADGYHELDSIVVFAGIADRLTFTRAGAWGLDVTGPFGSGLRDMSGNLVLRAAQAFAAAHPSCSAYHIVLEKNLPIASGIGGGSADAAACLRALAAMSGIGDTRSLAALALDLGADVPVCLAGQSCRMRGRGELIETWSKLAALPAVLVNPRVEIRTADVFAQLALEPGDEAFAPIDADADPAAWRNDLTAPALAIAPVIGEVMAALNASSGLRFARMSGSGATCFGIFPDAASAAEAGRRIGRDHPQWWVQATTFG